MSTEAKKHQASDQKLSKQREEGSVANVAEISNIGGTIVGIICLIALIPRIYDHLAVAFEAPILTYEHSFNQAVNSAFSSVGMALALAIAPLIVSASAASILTSLIYNKGVVFSMKPITPKLDRISIPAGFKRMFGRRTWVEVGISVLRIGACIVASAVTISFFFAALFKLDYCGTVCVVDLSLLLVKRLITIILVLLIITVLAEMIIQKNLFMHEQRMTDSEVKKEQKDNFGSNEVRQERNRIRNEDMQSAESTGADKANMCFYYGDKAIAVRYHPEHAQIPQISAKAGTAEKSLKLRQKLAGNGFGELEHQEVVEAAFKTQLGQNVRENAHKPLIDAMTKLFSRYT